MQDTKGVSMVSKKISIGICAGLGTLALASLPGLGAAQEADTRLGWQPYLGCWAQPAHLVEVDRPEGEEADAGVLCFVASGSDVEMLTIMDGAITHREPFPVDGQPRTVEQDGCRGIESARFSDDQRRIYTTSEVTCEDGAPRRSTGIISMPGLAEWLDVRAMEVDGRATAWSQWYQRTSADVLEDLGVESGQLAAPLAVRGAAMYAAARIELDDVIDASRNVHPKAVEAWLAETGQPFAGLDAENLIRLDDAGVPPGVIDVVVAVSFPQRFALNRQDAYAEPAQALYPRTVWAQRYYDPFYYGYGGSYGSRYGYGSRFGYGGYGYGGYYGWGGGNYRPVVVDVTRTQRQGGGRVVAGRGYRGPRSTVGPSRSSGGGAWSSGGSSSRGGAASSGGSRKAKPRGGSSGSIGSSSGSVSSAPARASTGSSSGARKAKPRGGK